ncbi:hypothetical protein [Isoptericola sp. BMS4]|uniref:hypothetical protein n=1 Tax=Isoptericola sp. BMS4 TaxID=2527875 RepID=UPI001424691A|nr:hypothetical protein [Isoptericola sp. BMS4]
MSSTEEVAMGTSAAIAVTTCPEATTSFENDFPPPHQYAYVVVRDNRIGDTGVRMLNVLHERVTLDLVSGRDRLPLGVARPRSGDDDHGVCLAVDDLNAAERRLDEFLTGLEVHLILKSLGRPSIRDRGRGLEAIAGGTHDRGEPLIGGEHSRAATECSPSAIDSPPGSATTIAACPASRLTPSEAFDVTAARVPFVLAA